MKRDILLAVWCGRVVKLSANVKPNSVLEFQAASFNEPSGAPKRMWLDETGSDRTEVWPQRGPAERLGIGFRIQG